MWALLGAQERFWLYEPHCVVHHFKNHVMWLNASDQTTLGCLESRLGRTRRASMVSQGKPRLCGRLPRSASRSRIPSTVRYGISYTASGRLIHAGSTSTRDQRNRLPVRCSAGRRRTSFPSTWPVRQRSAHTHAHPRCLIRVACLLCVSVPKVRVWGDQRTWSDCVMLLRTSHTS